MKKILHIVPFLLLFIFYACVKKDFKQVSSNVTFNPTYSLPIGIVSHNIYDFAPEYVFDCSLDTADFSDTLRFIESEGCFVPVINDTYTHTSLKIFDFSTLEDELENAIMIMFIINYQSLFPCQAQVAANFNDADRNTLFTLFDWPELMILPFENDRTMVILTQTEMDALPDVRFIEIITTIDISNISQRVIVFDPDDTIDVQIGLKAELEISTDNFL